MMIHLFSKNADKTNWRPFLCFLVRQMLLLVKTRGWIKLVLFSSQRNTYKCYSPSTYNILLELLLLFCQQVQRIGFILLGYEWFSAQETTTSKYIR